MKTLLYFVTLLFVTTVPSFASCQCDKRCIDSGRECDEGDGEPPCTNMTCTWSGGGTICYEATCFLINDEEQKITSCEESGDLSCSSYPENLSFADFAVAECSN